MVHGSILVKDDGGRHNVDGWDGIDQWGDKEDGNGQCALWANLLDAEE